MNDEIFDPSSVYQSLPDNSIRILVLESGDFSDPLQGHLTVQKVDTEKQILARAYEALSYTWGEAHNTRHIACSGARVPIRQNLYDALQHLRYPDRPRKLWIDALCINQIDRTEKAKQIPLMGYIFMNASLVLMWLGVGTPSTLRGLEFIKHGTECARLENLDSWHEIPPLTRWSNAESVARGFPSREGSVDRLLPICEFLSLKYFTRVWIIQEMIFAKSAVLVLGRQTIDYNDFFAALNFFTAKSYRFLVQGENILAQFRIFASLSRIGNEDLRHGTTTLFFLLSLTRNFQATDPRDKVFALLGLVERGEEFTVNYQASCKEIYSRAAQWISEEGKEDIFELFTEIQHDAHSLDEEFPSWVPRWHIPLSISSILSENFQASGSMVASSCLDFKNLETLHLNGIIIGKITEHNSPNNISRDHVMRKNIIQTYKLLSSTRKLIRQSKTYHRAGETQYEVLAKVLTTGVSVPSRKDQRGYLAWHFKLLSSALAKELRIQKFEEFENEEMERLLALQNPLKHEEIDDFWHTILANSRGRKAFLTLEGNLGLGPDCLRKEDLVCILCGGRIPYILRPTGDRFRFVGECYLHGYMHGEALQGGQFETQTFEIF